MSRPVPAAARSSTRRVRWGWLCGLMLLAGCAPPTRRVATAYADPPPTSLSAARWALRSATCVGADAPLPDLTGELRIVERPDGQLTFALDRSRGQCSATLLYAAQKRAACRPEQCELAIREEARSALGGEACLGRPDSPTATALRWAGRSLQFTVNSQELCGGLDVVLRFDAAPERPLDPVALVRHFFAEWNRTAPGSFAALFARDAVLVDRRRSPARTYAGEAAIAAWFQAELSASTWTAVRVVDLGTTDAARLTARWEYLDPTRETSLAGATHFILGGGAIFRAELWTPTATDP